MVQKVDADGSGEVEFDEFLEVMTQKPVHENTNQEVIRAFEFMSMGTATHDLGYGEARLDKVGHGLYLMQCRFGIGWNCIVPDPVR